ncbi:SusC/RagA family TonB-linked outer membrane protein [Gracilimonas amylolytica]|uniref:SusC/RagA family TonB-linked outer membrane protein n=1 Tax=Gracilimonas amylolytica TaxID=1749045 RepID=UPI000CD9A541|nr:SusC/RagA family TonB-linked outer membrane protein [Gracilimonas amylolytica]
MKIQIPHFITMIVLFCLPAMAFAQNGTIEGQVTDQSGEILIGVNVTLRVDGRTLGSSTDIDGNYQITGVPAGTHEVSARFVGFRTEVVEVTLQAGQTLVQDFVLSTSTLNLDELVVTGTGGTVQRKSLGHTISSVEFDGIENVATTSIQDALTGKIAGVNINAQSGAIDQEPKIRIRGTSSLSMTNQPLIYVDGVRVNGGGGFAPGFGAGGLGSPSGLSNINFDSIERVEILKGPAAATLYGSQASSGVIQIFTKQGSQESAPQFDIEYGTTLYQMPDRFRKNAGFAENATEQQNISDILGLDVDLYEPFETPINLIDLYNIGVGQEVSASVQGGGQSMTYFSNLRYTFTDGPFNPQPSDFNGGEVGEASDVYKKIYFTGNLNFMPSDKLTLRAQTSYTNSDISIYESGITIYTPTSTSRYAKPERVGQASQYDTFGIPLFATTREGTYPTVTDLTNQGRVVLKADYFPMEGLSIDASIGLDYKDQRSANYMPFGYNVDGVAPTGDGQIQIGTRQQMVKSFESKMNWIKDINQDIRSTFVAGFQAYQETQNTASSTGTGFSGPGLEVLGATASQTSDSYFQEVVNAGAFLQEQIDYGEWIYLTAGLRMDASSAFGDDFDYATYPKFSASFIPATAFNFEINNVSSFRIRGAWGQSGQQPGAFDRFTTFVPVNSFEGAGVLPGNPGNQDLKPEVATEWEVGFELGLFEDRIGVEATYWDRIVKDALIDRTYAPSGGFTSAQLTNAGRLAANGWEIGLNSNVIQNQNLTLNIFANAAYLSEKVESLGGQPPIKIDASYIRDRMFIKEGYAPGSYFGTMLPAGIAFPFDSNQDGVPDSQSELEAFFANPIDPGTFNSAIMVAGPNGEALPGGSTYLDHYLGKPTPDWEGSFGFTANIKKNVTVSSRFQYAFGNYYHHNLTDAFRRVNGAIGRNMISSATLESVLKNPSSTAQERIDAAQEWVNNNVSLSPFDGLNEIEKADYIRWANLSISYRIPSDLVERVGLNNASLTLSGNNLALWSKYGGVDPLATGEASLGQGASLQENFGGGMDTYGTPLLRTYALTLKFDF